MLIAEFSKHFSSHDLWVFFQAFYSSQSIKMEISTENRYFDDISTTLEAVTSPPSINSDDHTVNVSQGVLELLLICENSSEKSFKYFKPIIGPCSSAIYTFSMLGLLIGILCRLDVCGIKTKLCRRRKKERIAKEPDLRSETFEEIEIKTESDKDSWTWTVRSKNISTQYTWWSCNLMQKRK